MRVVMIRSTEYTMLLMKVGEKKTVKIVRIITETKTLSLANDGIIT